MRHLFTTTGLAAGLILGSAVTASAALIDFTDDDQWTGNQTVQNYGGLTVTLSSSVGTINFNEAFDGDEPAGSPLAFDNDGLGIDNDEITGFTITTGEIVTVSFSKGVFINRLFFLDLFESRIDDSEEIARVDLDNNGSFETLYDAVEDTSGDNPGYLDTTAGLPTGKVTAIRFTIFHDPTLNDDLGVADFALAGIEAQVPLPAGFVLLGSALAGLGLARRRRKA